MTRRQLTTKPSCMREIATFPSDRAALLWDKLDALVSDPLPDGKVKLVNGTFDGNPNTPFAGKINSPDKFAAWLKEALEKAKK